MVGISKKRKEFLAVRGLAAEIAGRQAFKEKRSAIPALDPEIKNILKGVKVGEASPILKRFQKGFFEA